MFNFIKQLYFFITNLKKTNEELQKVFSALMEFKTPQSYQLRRIMYLTTEQDLKDVRQLHEYKRELDLIKKEREEFRAKFSALNDHCTRLNVRNEKYVSLLEKNKIFITEERI